jgi:hypothetical protein
MIIHDPTRKHPPAILWKKPEMIEKIMHTCKYVKQVKKGN